MTSKNLFVAGALGVAALTGLGSASALAGDKTVLVVLAAASTKAAMVDVAAAFQKAHPDVSVQTAFGGSKVIAAQIQQGAAADVVLISDSVARELGGAIEGVVPIDRNHTTIVVNAASAAKVHGPSDLVKKGIRLGGGTPGSNIAKMGDETVANIAKQLGADYPAKFAANVTLTKTDNGKLAAAVESGSVDAAILYSSDVVAGKTVEVALPEQQRIYELHDVAVVKASAHVGLAKEFAAMLASPEAAAIFRAHHHDAAK